MNDMRVRNIRAKRPSDPGYALAPKKQKTKANTNVTPVAPVDVTPVAPVDVEEFLEEGVEEEGVDAKTGRALVKIDPRYFRPAEVDILQGDSTHAKKVLGWEPKTSFRDLIRIMLEADLKREGLEPSKFLKG